MNRADEAAEYGTWSTPGVVTPIHYAVPIFREIEFLVAEHFRRIPHGGIENGGLLYGTANATGIRVQAFRPIECEHAFGPTFQLSVPDIQKLLQQIRHPDAEFPDLSVLGWFISHSRTDLMLNETETLLATDLFPSPLAVTLLIKPERFRPTRFAFLPKDAAGAFQTNGRSQSFILPLPPRAAARKPSRRQPEKPEPLPEAPAAVPEIVSVAPPAAIVPAPASALEAAVSAPPLEQRTPVRTAYDRVPAAPSASYAVGRKLFWSIFLLAIATGLFAAYGFYQGAVPEVVPLQAKPYGGLIFISWPAQQTQNTASAAIRVNGGPLLPLSPVDRASGTTSIPLRGKDLRIELIARHWLHDTRGVIRVISEGD